VTNSDSDGAAKTEERAANAAIAVYPFILLVCVCVSGLIYSRLLVEGRIETG
jgi:hypothetical protein